MSLPSKICWFEGLGLSPQQFQQQDLYHEARLQHIAAALNPHLWGVRTIEWDGAALANNILQASAMSLVFQDGEVFEASAIEQLPAPIDLRALPASAQHCTYYAALPRLNLYGNNLSRSSGERVARYTQRDRDTIDLYSDAIETPVLFLQKNVRLLSQSESRDNYVAFPIVRVRRRASGGFELDPTFFAPSLSTGASAPLHAMLESLLARLYVKIEALYGRHRQVSEDVFEIQSVDITSYLLLNTITSASASLSHCLRYRAHHPERLFDKLSALAGGLLAFSRRYSVDTFPAYDHENAAAGFLQLDTIIRDLIEVTLSSRYHVIELVKDAARSNRHVATLSAELVNQTTLLGMAVSADLPALELVAAVPVRFKISGPADIDNIVQFALSGVKLNHMAQVPAAVPVRPNTQYFSLESKGDLYEAMLRSRTLSLEAPGGIPGLKIELFCLAQ
ncbi:type VI secretion system baseplate subunit TssK [Massilia sp. PWRC2]|uniref:type VI secretion system baseplate subunit TssK n=1 Tax=Massilia sp. PWRC2 TaxID=2804626 RepID=UPI003CF20DA7